MDDWKATVCLSQNKILITKTANFDEYNLLYDSLAETATKSYRLLPTWCDNLFFIDYWQLTIEI